MTPDIQPPILERFGYTWVQHPDGLYYGPPYPGDDDTLVFLEADGTLGHSSVRRGDYRYFLRDPDAAEDRRDRFIWMEDGDLRMEPPAEGAEGFDTYDCPTHGTRRASRGEVRQAERDETCLYVCTLCGQVADPRPFHAGPEEDEAC